MSDDQTAHLKTTPLDELHRSLKGKMVPFAGYAMPVQYPTGIIAEHRHTREKCSLFDVSHMGQLAIRGKDAAQALETLVTGDLREAPIGKTIYTLLTNDEGGIIDDLMVTTQIDHLFLVVNAANKERDIAHLRSRLSSQFQIDVLERALLALQGPAAVTVLARFAPACRHMTFMTGSTVTIQDLPCYITRSGYTGEDGFEIAVEADKADALADLLLAESEVKPAGLGARDTLRLEAGLCLHGHDIDETTNPIEAGLAWTIGRRRRSDGGFPGAENILKQIGGGTARKRVGIRLEGRAPAREHTEIVDQRGESVGHVTSGGFGPTANAAIAMGYVKTELAQPGIQLQLVVRGKPLKGEVVKLPFVEHHYYKG
jgi:aminomethyltransferase